MYKLLFVLVLLFSTQLVFAQDSYKDLSQLEWLAGKWTVSGQNTTVVEHWKKVSEYTYEGSASTIKNTTGDTTFVETLRIVLMSGDIFYIPYVSHNPLPVAFKLISSTDKRYVFENPEHDFPQRIIYIFESTDAFAVRVEGMEKGKERGFDVPYKRAAN